MRIDTNKIYKNVLITLGILIILIVFLEAGIALFLRFPSMMVSHEYISGPIYEIYVYNYRNVIQVEPLCAVYNPKLTYTLRPGTFVFKNPEFETIYNVNHLGLRDDEYSLNGPDIIVIGDSYAMGWGVEQNETFSQVIENKTGLKVLNASISSYGSVRELMMLDNLDTSRMKYLIIYYCDNDVDENKSFYENNNVLKISPISRYQKGIEEYYGKKKYYPFKYVIKYIKYLLKETLFYKKNSPNKNYEVKIFTNALIHASKTDFSKAKIIILAPGNFVKELSEELKNGSYPVNIKKAVILDVNSILDTSECFFIIDDHITREGHRKLADRIIENIR